ncbi:MAG TPA: hypothetical protein VF796_20000 [Humisphaera sp.]
MSRLIDAVTFGFLALLAVVAPPGRAADGPTTAPASRRAKDAAATRVLYVEGYPRWDYRYLVQWLARDRGVLSSVYLASADPKATQPGDRPISRVPETADEFAGYEVVILGDVDPRLLTDQQMTLLARRVEAGAGLVMLAGARHDPAAYRGTPLAAALPVELPAEPARAGGVVKEGFQIVVTAEGKRSPCFRFRDDPASNEKALAELDPLFWSAAGVTAKPGATVWAVHPTPGADGKRAPLMVAGEHGKGRVLYIGFDDTWRWRRMAGEASAFDAFWTGAIRAVAPPSRR